MDIKDDLHNYEDIINMPHHVSKTRPHMSMQNRAAQFMPFKAVSGHEEAVHETERITDNKVELDESAKIILDQKLQIVVEHLCERPEIEVRYFVPDKTKAGGAFVTAIGHVRRIDSFARLIVFEETEPIEIEQIVEMEGEIFDHCFL